MSDIPKHIADRCQFKPVCKGDPIEKIHDIQPVEPCPCGAVLSGMRVVRIGLTIYPERHWREYCNTCKLTSKLGENDWKPAQKLNQEMRAQNLGKTHTEN